MQPPPPGSSSASPAESSATSVESPATSAGSPAASARSSATSAGPSAAGVDTLTPRLLLGSAYFWKRFGDTARATMGSDFDACTVPGDGEPPLDDATLARIEVGYLSPDMVSPDAPRGIGPVMTRFVEALRAAPNLKWLQICSAGADRPFIPELAARGVMVTTGSGANARSTSMAAIAGMLALFRGFPHWHEAKLRHAWEPLRGARAPRDVDGATATVVGLGPIGTETARVCRALGMQTIGVRRSSAPHPECDEVVAYESLASVLPRTDALLLTCPLGERTRGLVDAAALALLPPHAYLVNVARGPVVVEDALLAALREQRLAGAYSDVFAREPLPADSPLWDEPRLLISAHSGGVSRGFDHRTAAILLDNLQRFRAGRPLVNRAVFET